MRNVCIALLLAVFSSTYDSAPLRGQGYSRDAQRLIAAMGIQAGMTVGEIGAGSGELTVLIAQHVGAAGKVYSTEITEQRLPEIRKAVADARIANVTVIMAANDRTNLPAGCCDVIFMRNVYHHFAQPAAINVSLFAALKPGGRVGVIDGMIEGTTEAATPGGRSAAGTHGVTSATVARELETAGFARVSVQEPRSQDEGFLVVMRKPAR